MWRENLTRDFAIGGGSVIRTHGALSHTGFAVPPLRPLGHTSIGGDFILLRQATLGDQYTALLQIHSGMIWAFQKILGGELGIRTLDTVFTACSFSRRVPSTARPTLRSCNWLYYSTSYIRRAIFLVRFATLL